MRTILLRSVIFALLLIPFIAARERNPMRGLRMALALFVAFSVLYMLALRFVYPHLS